MKNSKDNIELEYLYYNHFKKISIILLLLLSACQPNQKPFTNQNQKTNPNQSKNTHLLQKIKNDTTITKDKMIFSFYYITNTRAKIDALIDYLKANEPNQPTIELNKINQIWELNGRTYPIQLQIDSINQWEIKMRAIGYQFDCELDGWDTIDLKTETSSSK